MLDTNICIYLIKNRPSQVRRKFDIYEVGEICISSITVAELYYGVQKSQMSEQNERALALFLAPLNIVQFDEHAAIEYGKIRATLEAKGTVIGSLDMLIAAHAKSLGVLLVTNNMKEFQRVDALSLENWVE
ncbi:MAG: VapC toxin family PIN domain ribonuclease [Helicobacteraceae bacterium CG2_30_36_10]|nr:MAG: VapC toxin family PIN domain ribonuclease [Helicobacteraceae bacterium CG2_30_36_10]